MRSFCLRAAAGAWQMGGRAMGAGGVFSGDFPLSRQILARLVYALCLMIRVWLVGAYPSVYGWIGAIPLSCGAKLAGQGEQISRVFH